MTTVTGLHRTKKIVRPARRVPGAHPPRERKPVIHPRGPLALTPNPVQTDGPGDVPNYAEIGQATLDEWYVWWWLTRKRKLIPNVDFEFQSSLFGGRKDLGGLVVDFLVKNTFSPGLVINVQGYHWHRFATTSRANDLLVKMRLQGPPYFFKVVYVLEDDVLQRLDSTMTLALQGIQKYADSV